MRNIEGVAVVDPAIGAFSLEGEARQEKEVSDTLSLADSTAYRMLEDAV